MKNGLLNSVGLGAGATAGPMLRAAALVAGVAGGIVMPTGLVLAQGVSDAQPFAGRPVERVTIRITNPSDDAAFNARIEDSVRRALGVFPGDTYSEDRLTFALGAARRNASIGNLSHDAQATASGGVDVAIAVTLRGRRATGQGPRLPDHRRSGGFPLGLRPGRQLSEVQA